MANAFTYLFLAALVLSTATRLWLAMRHARHVERHRAAVPAEFAGQIGLDAHQKAADYSVAKTRFNNVGIAVEVVLLSIDHDSRDELVKLLRSQNQRRPVLIAVVGYENPSTLQLVLESGALAVVERPIRPFGLLTNLTIARSLWIERQDAARRIRKLERKLSGIQKIQKAKSILMEKQGLGEEEAYQTLRRQAMAKRVPMEEMATAIINADELLHSRPKGA